MMSSLFTLVGEQSKLRKMREGAYGGNTQDPLQPVSLEMADKLLEILKSDFPYSLTAYGHLETFIRWYQREGGKRMDFYTPFGRIEQGAVVGIYKATDLYYYITIHCVDDDVSALKNALLTTRRLKWDVEGLQVTFSAFTKKCLPIVEELLAQKGLETTLISPMVKLWQTPKNYTPIDEHSPEVQIALLDASHAKQLEQHWPHRFKNAKSHIERLVTHNFGLGAFLRSTNELVAWQLVNHCNTLGMYYVKPEYRRKGYALFVGDFMLKELHRSGNLVQTNVIAQNVRVVNTIKKQGFDSCLDFLRIEARYTRKNEGESKLVTVSKL